MIAFFWNFGTDIGEITKNSNFLFQRDLQVTTNLKKQWLQTIKWNKEHPSKQAVFVTCTLEEKFFAATTFVGLWVISFETE